MKPYLKDHLAKLKADAVKAHKSLTIWFNSVMGVAVVVLPMAQDNFAQLQDYLPAELYHDMMGLLVVGNIILRFRTSTALSAK